MTTHSFPAALIFEDGDVKWANLVTLSRAALIAPIIALLLAGLRTPALALYILAALTDAVDGWIARRTGRNLSYLAQEKVLHLLQKAPNRTMPTATLYLELSTDLPFFEIKQLLELLMTAGLITELNGEITLIDK